MGSGRSKNAVALHPTCTSVMTRVGSHASWPFEFDTMMKLILAVLCVVLLLGCYGGFKLATWWVAPPGASLEGSVVRTKAKRKKVHKSTQSQVKYTWKAVPSRFTPLAEFDHGCWEFS